MQFINYLKSKLPFYVALSFTFILASCGSYQYVGYDNDGIYGSEAIATEQPVTSNSASYYKNYFAEKSQQLEIPEEDIIFTDIDSYEGDYNEVEDSNYVSGNAGWGQTSDSFTINVYPSYGYSSWWYNPFSWNWYTPYYGWGYYGNWGYPYYGSWGYYGNWGYPYYGNWGYIGNWGYPYYNNHYYYNGYNNVSYNAGRRGSINNYSSIRTANYTADRTSSINRRSSSTLTRDYSATSRNRLNTLSTSTRNRTNSFSTTNRRSPNTLSRPGVNSYNQNRNSTISRPRTTTSRPNDVNRSYSSPRSSNNYSPSINRSSSSSGSSSRSSFSSSSRSSGGSSPARSSSSGRRGNQ